ncbi:MAG: type II toxin-antitoxin system HicA family toxin [Deltaproteobacteria bacterium]|nr:type II toxin-antitoxin system HicA family toxin [Deltaproteobacteria bacterium]
MKRKDILKKLAEAGFTFKEGDDHTKVYDKNGVFRSVVGRHTEIPEWTARAIAKQTGVKLN